jgi:hypothetical protein
MGKGNTMTKLRITMLVGFVVLQILFAICATIGSPLTLWLIAIQTVNATILVTMAIRGEKR